MENAVKICTKCRQNKDLTLFPARKRASDGRASWCKACFKENWEERYSQNHQFYRNSHNRSQNKRREENARKVFDFLAQNSCQICGESDPVVLEFDHRNGLEKSASISNLIRDASWETIESEIRKCDVLCANCHRRKSAAQFGYKRHVFVNI
jgi:hypothetical protein